jgi:hypothetical protein
MTWWTLPLSAQFYFFKNGKAEPWARERKKPESVDKKKVQLDD